MQFLNLSTPTELVNMVTCHPSIMNALESYLFSIITLCIICTHSDLLSDLLSKSKQNNGIIEGNPLLYPECRNALLNRHESNLEYLNKSALPSPWFWSRESLDAVMKNIPLKRRTKLTFNFENTQYIPYHAALSYEYASKHRLIPVSVLNWYLKLGEQINREIFNDKSFPFLPVHNDDYDINDSNHENVCFYHIEKSGSSSISGMMHEYHFNTSYTSEDAKYDCKCGFTFLRDPISRFVSGYYTINKLIYWYHHHLKRVGRKGPNMSAVPNRFKFWNITGEPQRMIQFIDDIWDYSFEFTQTTPLEHMMTQSGLLAVAQVDIHYIGNVNNLMQHLEIIKNKCAEKTNNEWMLKKEIVEKQVMTHFGTKWMDELRPWYTDMLSLDSYEAGDLEPAYLAIADNYDLYSKIVQFYKQDYICFGFDHDWIKFRNKIYHKYHKTKERKKQQKLNETRKLVKG